ncbi:hypothetical protein [Herbidospora sp. RD11066]
MNAPAAWADSEPSSLSRLVGADLGSVIGLVPSLLCGNRLINYNSPSIDSPTTCVNGPVASGNSVDSGNYTNEGNPVNSGNFANTNGSTGSSNQANSGNMAGTRQQTQIRERAK